MCGSLFGPLSSLTSIFCLLSGLIMLSPERAVAPLNKWEKNTVIKTKLFNKVYRTQCSAKEVPLNFFLYNLSGNNQQRNCIL